MKLHLAGGEFGLGFIGPNCVNRTVWKRKPLFDANSLAVAQQWQKNKRIARRWISFADERRPGRPKTNPLSRDEQLRINKRNQLRRDKVRGLRRVELKINADAVDALNKLADQRNISRSELIEQMLLAQLAEEQPEH